MLFQKGSDPSVINPIYWFDFSVIFPKAFDSIYKIRMTAPNYFVDQEEIRFLLEKVLQVKVLCHAPAFQGYELNDFLEIIEQSVQFFQFIIDHNS